MSDPQDQAEMLDEDIVDSQDDRTGDEYGAALPEFPPEEPLGVQATGTTPVGEDAGESFAERTAHSVDRIVEEALKLNDIDVEA